MINSDDPARVVHLGQPRDFLTPLFSSDVKSCYEYIWSQAAEVRRTLVVISERWFYSPQDIEAERISSPTVADPQGPVSPDPVH